MPKSCPFCPFLQGYNIVIPKEREKAMVRTEEKLEKEVVDLYLFANIMYGDVLDSISKKKKAIGFEEERFLEYINKSVKISVESYFADLKLTKSFLKSLMKNKGNILLI